MSACRSCKASILWAVTAANRRIPMDAKPVVASASPADWRPGLFTLQGSRAAPAMASNEGDWVGLPLYQSHFASCPDAPAHRKHGL